MSRDWYALHIPTHHQLFKRETFVNGICDVEVKKILQLSRYQTLSEALIRAPEVEAAYNSSRTCHKVRVSELRMEKNDWIKKILETLSQQMNGTSQRFENGMPRKRSLEYVGTGLSCSITSSEEKHTTEISSTKCAGKLKTSSTLGDVLAGKNKTPREVKIGSFTKDSSSTAPGKINASCVSITIDIGTEVSILCRGLKL